MTEQVFKPGDRVLLKGNRGGRYGKRLTEALGVIQWNGAVRWFGPTGVPYGGLGLAIPHRDLKHDDRYDLNPAIAGMTAQRIVMDEWQKGLLSVSEAASGEPRKPESGSRGDALARGDRMDEYGHPKVSFDRIAALWSALLSAPEVDPENLTGENVGQMMVLLKVSRSITDGKADTLDDIEGYVSCIRMLRDPDTI